MKSLIKLFFKKLFSIIGIEVSRIRKEQNKFAPSEKDKFKWIQNMNIKTVIDIGANEGQVALQFNKLFPNAKIYAFEPLHDCFIKLNANLKNVPNFKSFNLALGDKKENKNIYRSSFAPSSSLLKMKELHKELFTFSADETLETIAVDTLDNVMEELELNDNILLKIDVQGYEDRVIMGARNILGRAKVIIIETSFNKLYEGQPQFSDIYELLYKQRFVYSGSWEEWKSPVDGIPLQQDSIFIKTSNGVFATSS